MWNVPPRYLCRKHLLGEHVECHMFVGAIRKGTSLSGYVDGGLVNTRELKTRHDALAAEIERRGYQHASPLPRFKDPKVGEVDSRASARELKRRCRDCYA
jgi:hypothetical protein